MLIYYDTNLSACQQGRREKISRELTKRGQFFRENALWVEGLFSRSEREVKNTAPEIIIAGMSLLGTLAGSFAGIYVSGSLTQYRLRQLEEKVNRHNNLIERTFKLEQECAVLEERVRAADRRIDGLEEEHI